MENKYECLRVRADGAVLSVEIDAPPINQIGPELVRDLVSLIKLIDEGNPYKVVVFSSANPDFFLSHVNVNKIKEYREAAAALTGEASIAMLFRRMSQAKAITIAQIDGRVRGAGSEFVLACDLSFAAEETALFCQMEGSFGVIPGGGAIQHLARRMGRSRALEVVLSADDFSAKVAEAYGWINRSLPKEQLREVVMNLAHRIASFPLSGLIANKQRVNEITLAGAEAFRRDSDMFGKGVAEPAVQERLNRMLERGFGMSSETEINLGRELGKL